MVRAEGLAMGQAESLVQQTNREDLLRVYAVVICSVIIIRIYEL
jgi:hypothetical protein